MKFNFLLLVAVGLILSSPVLAKGGNHKEDDQKMLETLQKAHYHGVLFDEATSGGMPFEEYDKK